MARGLRVYDIKRGERDSTMEFIGKNGYYVEEPGFRLEYIYDRVEV